MTGTPLLHSGRVVAITGAGGGIGSAIALRFLDNDDIVMATDRSERALEQLAGRARHRGRLHTAVVDVTSDEDCQSLAADLRTALGRVDVLVNCAGFFPTTAFDDITTGDWKQVVDVNLTGTFLMTRAMLDLMKGSGWGRIVKMASSSVFSGVPGRAHYVAAKVGVIGLTRTLARELGPHGITVNAVAPGLTVTAPVRDTMPVTSIARQREGRAIVRDQQPADVVGPVSFLASAEAALVTGQTLIVDGGKLMS